MREIELPAIKESSEDYEKLEQMILKIFREEIYLPLLSELGADKTILTNATEDLIEALRSGRIHFYRGQFTGRFNAAVSRELKRIGAVWDRKHGAWKIPSSSLSIEIKNAIENATIKFEKMAKQLDKRLKQMLPEEIADKLKAEKIFDTTLFKVDESLRKSIKGISVPVSLTPARRKELAKEYTNNMRIYIKEFSEREISRLRKQVQEKVFAGFRYETMVKTIQTSYDVSESKAKFIARQETVMLVSKFKEIRYKDAGITQYKWTTVAGSKSHPVRPMHKKLDGKIFDWDDPPITSKDGRRNNPGEDYGCRCIARPVVKF